MIVKPRQPPRGKEIVRAALGCWTGSSRPVRSLKGAPRIGAALPLYRIDEKAPEKTISLSTARKAGWQYPLVGGSVPGLAILRKRSGLPLFVGINEGQFPARVLRAAVFAEKKLKSSDIEFEARLLEIPFLRFHALWLFAPRGQSLFIRLSHHGKRFSPRLERDIGSFADRLIPATAYFHNRKKKRDPHGEALPKVP